MKFLEELGIGASNSGACMGPGKWLGCNAGRTFPCINPTTGESIAEVRSATTAEYEQVMASAADAFQQWRQVPAPRRGEVVRRLGDALRAHKDALGSLVSTEVGKIKAEGDGEVQEMIDIADLATGALRQERLVSYNVRPMTRADVEAIYRAAL